MTGEPISFNVIDTNEVSRRTANARDAAEPSDVTGRPDMSIVHDAPSASHSPAIPLDSVRFAIRGRRGRDAFTLLSRLDTDLMQWRWGVNGGGYAQRSVTRGGRPGCLLLHREVLARIAGRELRRDEVCDHINGDRLDNRRENLRVVTSALNNQNITRALKNNRYSPLRGVSFHKKMKKWQANVCFQGKQIWCGTHTTPEAAAEAAREKRSALGFMDNPVAGGYDHA